MASRQHVHDEERSGRTTLWSLCGNALWRIVASQLWNSAIIVKFKEKKFCPGPGLEPGPLAFRANALPLSYPEQVRVHGRINLLELSFQTSGLTNCFVTMSHGGTHSLFRRRTHFFVSSFNNITHPYVQG